MAKLIQKIWIISGLLFILLSLNYLLIINVNNDNEMNISKKVLFESERGRVKHDRKLLQCMFLCDPPFSARCDQPNQGCCSQPTCARCGVNKLGCLSAPPIIDNHGGIGYDDNSNNINNYNDYYSYGILITIILLLIFNILCFMWWLCQRKSSVHTKSQNLNYN